MTTEQLQDKCRGSLVGGAVGDALGGFSSPEQIKERYVNHQPFNVNPLEIL